MIGKKVVELIWGITPKFVQKNEEAYQKPFRIAQAFVHDLNSCSSVYTIILLIDNILSVWMNEIAIIYWEVTYLGRNITLKFLR